MESILQRNKESKLQTKFFAEPGNHFRTTMANERYKWDGKDLKSIIKN